MKNNNFTKESKLNKVLFVIRTIVAVLSLLIPAYLAATKWQALTGGHPAYPIALGLVFIIGAALLVTYKKKSKNVKLQNIRILAGSISIILILGILFYLKPATVNAESIAAAKSSETVEVTQRWDEWTLEPAEKSNVGIVFYPGMLVEPRGYFPLLRPFVEEGITVVVPTEPLGLTINGQTSLDKAKSEHPEIDTWIVGRHSMGGAVASSVTAHNSDLAGLFIWASYSNDDLTKSETPVILLYGTYDPFGDEKIINEKKYLLPDTAEIVKIEGAIHAHFADYIQAGDGIPTIDALTAREEIVEKTLGFVNEIK